MTQRKVAELTGVSLPTVNKVSQRVNNDEEHFKRLLSVYRAQLKKSLPVTKRVSIISKIAENEDQNPFARLKAIELADKRDGLVVETVNPGQSAPPVQPMFVLPPGSQVMIGVKTPQPEGETIEQKSTIRLTTTE